MTSSPNASAPENSAIDPSRALILAIPGQAGERIVPGSAILSPMTFSGQPAVNSDGWVRFWFEGNTNGAVNLVSFIDKLRCAGGRLAFNYPTIAFGAVPVDQIHVLGEFDIERGIVLRIDDQKAMDRQAGEDTAWLCRPSPTAVSRVTDIEDIMAAHGRPGTRLLAHEDLIWQTGCGRIIHQEPIGDLVMDEPESHLAWSEGNRAGGATHKILLGSAFDERLRARMLNTLGKPVLQTAAGNWHEIRTIEQAHCATRAGETAIRQFWSRQQASLAAGEDDPLRWFVLLNAEGGAVVSLAAMSCEDPRSPEDLTCAVAVDCHVTGHRNQNAWPQYHPEIMELASQEGLKMRPNHMGMDIPDPQSGNPEP